MNLQQRVKEFLQEESSEEKTLKHLMGEHPQSRHGNRGGSPGDYARGVAEGLDKFDFTPNSYGGSIKKDLKGMINAVGSYSDRRQAEGEQRERIRRGSRERHTGYAGTSSAELRKARKYKSDLEKTYNDLIARVEGKREQRMIQHQIDVEKMIKSVGGKENIVKKSGYGLWTEFDFGGDNFSSFTP